MNCMTAPASLSTTRTDCSPGESWADVVQPDFADMLAHSAMGAGQDDLSSQVAAAQAASKAKSDLLAILGHELRTPLNAISGYVQLLAMDVYGPISESQRDILMRVERAQRHLLDLVKDVTELVRVEGGHLTIRNSEVKVAELAADLEGMVGPQARARSITFRIADCEGCVVLADRDRLLQILLNLLSNAVKFTPEGGRVLLDCPKREFPSPDESLAYLRVRDTGSGIALDRQSAVFEPFVQLAKEATTRAQGAGLGLTISRDLAQAMHGELRLRSVPGKGCSFTVALPRVHVASS